MSFEVYLYFAFILKHIITVDQGNYMRSEAVTRGVLYEKVFLEKVFSCEFCQISKNTFFTEHVWTTASMRCFMKSFWLVIFCANSVVNIKSGTSR